MGLPQSQLPLVEFRAVTKQARSPVRKAAKRLRVAGGLVAGADIAGLSRKSQGAELGLLLKIATHAGPESAIDDATGRQRYQVITLSLYVAGAVFLLGGLWLIFGTQGLFPPDLSRPMGLAFMISAAADVIAIEIARFIENKNVSTTEFMLMAQRLLKDDSRLRKVILKWMPS